MIEKITSERIVTPHGIEKGAIYLKDGKILAVGEMNLPYEKKVNAGDDYVLPGMIDIHTHGATGHDYSDSDPDGIIEAIRYSVDHGATSVLPTITSSSYKKTYTALSNLERAMMDPVYGSRILGAHLEGPYFSEKQSGAQNKEFITDPKQKDYERLLDRFGSIILRWDYAPERDRDGAFCSCLARSGVIPAAGHTDAKYDDMLVAKKNGCRLITHLYSCTSTITREMGYRKLGVIECAYLWDDLYVEIIADGSHLPIELLQLIFKLKPQDKIILITDSMSVTGTEANSGVLNGVEYLIEDGVCKLIDRSAFAGSIATARDLMKVCARAGKEAVDIAKMGSENPASLLGLKKGRIEVGYDADIIIATKDYDIKAVYAGGERIR